MKLFIDAILGGMYLVSTDEKGTVLPVQDEANNLMCFQCLDQVKQHFEDKLLDEVWLRQDSLIDELLGFTPEESVQLDWC